MALEIPAPNPADESPHEPGPEELWNESWYFDFCRPDGGLGGYVRIGKYPNLGVVWYWACLVGPDRKLVTVIDHEVPLPSGSSLEVRHDGLWADHNIEEPNERWSLGLEAFAVELDHPADTYHGAAGERVPFGFDLEWETDGEVFPFPVGLTRYEVPCRVHGEIQVGSDTIAFDGYGQRDHSWGLRDWWGLGWCWTAFRLDGSAERFHAVTTKPEGLFAMGYHQAPGAPTEVVTHFSTREELDGEGIPTGAIAYELRAQDEGAPTRRLTVEPIAWSPVLLVAPDGREARFPRAMARFRDLDTGDAGLGWLEFGQPPPPPPV